MKKEPTEEDFKRVLERLRSKNPLWKEHEEFGKLLMKHIDDFTDEERKRFFELKIILESKPSNSV